MNRPLRILHVGRRYRNELAQVAPGDLQIVPVRSIYEALIRLRRDEEAGILVELAEIQDELEEALPALRRSAGTRPMLVLMSIERWDELRPSGLLRPEETLVCPFYPGELWNRLQKKALPDPAQAARRLGRDADRLAALIEDTRDLHRLTSNLPAWAERLVDLARVRSGAGRISLFVKEPEGEDMPLAHGVGLRSDVRKTARCVPGRGIAGRLVEERKAVLVREAGEDGPSTGREYAHPSYMVLPLAHQGEVLGVLCVSERLEAGPFEQADLDYLEALCDAAAQALHNALLLQAADELATIDELTQLFNRRHFNRMLRQEVERARRYGRDLTLAMFDVDHFKLYNDTRGHQAGDEALVAIAKVLKASFREADVVVRWAGEEFAVIMPETSRLPGNGVDFVDRARRAIEEADLRFDAPNTPPRLTVSGGVATYPVQAKNADDLIRKADQALFEAKRGGRNKIVGA